MKQSNFGVFLLSAMILALPYSLNELQMCLKMS